MLLNNKLEALFSYGRRFFDKYYYGDSNIVVVIFYCITGMATEDLATACPLRHRDVIVFVCV